MAQAEEVERGHVSVYIAIVWYDPWSGDSMEKTHLTYSPLLLDRFLTEDSLVLSIYESEVSFEWNASVALKIANSANPVALPMKKLWLLLKKDCV